MKKNIFVSFFSVIFSMFLITTVSASNQELPEWFIEIDQDDLNVHSNHKLNSLKISNNNMDLEKVNNQEENYLFLHNNGEILDPSKANQFIDGEVDFEDLEDFNVVGISKYEANGTIYTNFIYSNAEEESYSDILESTLDNAYKIYNESQYHELGVDLEPKEENEKDEFQSFSIQANALNSVPRYLDSNTFRVNNGNVLTGIYTSNAEFLRQGKAYLNGKSVSVWDVKYFNQTEPKNGYQTREIITRFAVTAQPNQTLLSYGPTTTGKNSSASISLSGLVPSFGWSFNTYDARVTDSSSMTNKYARWTFLFALGSKTAKNSYAMKPGARITNAVGQAGFTTTQNMEYYKNLNSVGVRNTGKITRYFKDL